MTNIQKAIARADKILCRIEPEYYGLAIEDDKIAFIRNRGDDPDGFYSIEMTSDYKKIVRKFVDAIASLNAFARECYKWGCD